MAKVICQRGNLMLYTNARNSDQTTCWQKTEKKIHVFICWNQVLIDHLTFYASLESKTYGIQNTDFFADTLQSISFKMTCTSCTDDVREKVPSFLKVTLFLRYKIFIRGAINLGFCLFKDVTDYRDWRRINLKVFFFFRLNSSVLLHNNIRLTF